MINNIIKLLRIHHWIKNIVVIIPLIFYFSLSNFYRVGTAFVAFCLISSVIYILNDLNDIEEDKLHPLKQERPIPSGKISKKTGIIIACVLFITSLLLSFGLSVSCGVIVLLYTLNNLLYTLFLRKLPILDLISITLGFIFRLFVGYYAIPEKPPLFIILIVISVAFFFEFSKRYVEYGINTFVSREALKIYSIEVLRKSVIGFAVLSVVIYSYYAISLGGGYFYSIVPFTLIGLRWLKILLTDLKNDDLVILIYKDKIIILLLLLLFATLFLVKHG